MKRILLWGLLINSPIFGMWCCKKRVAQTKAFQRWIKDENGYDVLFQYDKSSDRWKLIQYTRIVRQNDAGDKVLVDRFYQERGAKAVAIEDLQEVETISIEQYRELDFKRDGEFVTGTGTEKWQ
jgi:hypothetical protein